MSDEKHRKCIVCGLVEPEDDMICIHCKAVIRGEAIEHQHHDKKEADKVLHKEGSGDIPKH
jgi:predicted nucleic acid-binding Zn ribbon protein